MNRGRPIVLPPEIDAAQMERDFWDGMTMRAIGAKHGMSDTQARRVLDQIGVPKRPPGRPPGQPSHHKGKKYPNWKRYNGVWSAPRETAE